MCLATSASLGVTKSRSTVSRVVQTEPDEDIVNGKDELKKTEKSLFLGCSVNNFIGSLLKDSEKDFVKRNYFNIGLMSQASLFSHTVVPSLT